MNRGSVTFTMLATLLAAGCVARDGGSASRSPGSPETRVEAGATSRPDSLSPRAAAVRVVVVGTSVQGREILAYHFGPGPHETLIFSAIHGDETIAAEIGRRFVDELIARPSVLEGRSVIVIPHANPDGVAARTRVNARGVDLNRNFAARNWRVVHAGRNAGGPSPLSEPETRAIASVLDAHPLRRIVSIHAMHRGPCNNFDGPGEPLASAMARHNGYPVLASIGYPTPGSFGSFAGHDRQIAVVTLELPSRGKPDAEWPKNRAALLEAVRAGDPAGPSPTTMPR